MPRARRKTPAPAHRCGFAAIVGRPNVGKSTLLNALIGTKVSIVTPKPQTTRHLVTGIVTRPDCQYVFVDAPGQQSRSRSVLHRNLNRRATQAARDADVALFVVEALRFGPDDHAVLDRIPVEQRVIAVVNKIDTVKKHADLIPFLDRLAKTRKFEAVVPVSARTGRNIAELFKALCGIGVRGDDHRQRRRARRRPDATQHLEAVDLRQHEIEQHDVG